MSPNCSRPGSMGGNVSIFCWLVPWGHPGPRGPWNPRDPGVSPNCSRPGRISWGATLAFCVGWFLGGHPGPREGGTFPPGEGWDHYNRGRGGALGPGSLNPSRLLGFRSFCGPLEGLPRPLEVRLRPKMKSVSRKIPLQVFCTSSILEWGLVMGRLREPYGGGLFLLKSRRADAQLESHKEVVTLVPGELEVCFQCWAHEFLHVTESFYYSVVGKLSTMMRTILKTVIIKASLRMAWMLSTWRKQKSSLSQRSWYCLAAKNLVCNSDILLQCFALRARAKQTLQTSAVT